MYIETRLEYFINVITCVALVVPGLMRADKWVSLKQTTSDLVQECSAIILHNLSFDAPVEGRENFGGYLQPLGVEGEWHPCIPR
jgi:hypothetical protein